MSKPFLKLVAEQVHKDFKDRPDSVLIVLPGKRAALFLKQHLAQVFGRAAWLPSMITAEELMCALSGLKMADETDLLCFLYDSYRQVKGTNAEPFESFARWGSMLLRDFNEVDRYLCDTGQLYGNLKDIREIENWSLGAPSLTSNQQAYLEFMAGLAPLYRHFTEKLLSEKLCYHGLACRVASSNFHDHDFLSPFSHVICCGLNALNAAEEKIFSGLKSAGRLTMIWDADRYYIDDEFQEAGVFLRKNFARFGDPMNLFMGDHFRADKKIEVISVPKAVGQAQVVAGMLQQLSVNDIGNTAVVLANESLLPGILDLIPDTIETVNVTMGFPLRNSAAYDLVELLLQVHHQFFRQGKEKSIYHRDLTALLRHPMFAIGLQSELPGVRPDKLIQTVNTRNLSFVTPAILSELFSGGGTAVPKVLVSSDGCSVVRSIIGLIARCAEAISAETARSSALELECLYQLHTHLNRIDSIITRQPELSALPAIKQLFQEVCGAATVSFSGEPLTGLQVMGMLETRCLDFEHVILVGANEGVLPSGRTVTSFIPNDLKRAFGMPVYSEKDAVYAYHFYRLLQRAIRADIIYDSEPDTFGKGEQSRFVTQLIAELPSYHPSTTIARSVAGLEEAPGIKGTDITIAKNENIIREITEKAFSADVFGGISPSALSVFKDCSLQYYFRYGGGLKESGQVEESAESSTFGSILHLSLQNLYGRFEGRNITEKGLKALTEEIGTVVHAAFMTFFGSAKLFGKSLLQEEVIGVYVRKLVLGDLRWVQRLAEEKESLELLHVEKEFSAPLNVSVNGVSKPVIIRGKVDRIDRHRGIVRLVDYKSSVQKEDAFEFAGFDALFGERSYNKQLQLMIYAWLLHSNGVPASSIRPCIIPFKVYSDDPYYIEDASGNPMVFTRQQLDEFGTALAGYVAGIFDTRIPFEQTHDTDLCEWCAYGAICNRVK